MVKIPLSPLPEGQQRLRVRDNFLIADYPRGTLRLLVTWDQLVEKAADPGVPLGRDQRAKDRVKYLQLGIVTCPTLPFSPAQLRSVAAAAATAKLQAAAAAAAAAPEPAVPAIAVDGKEKSQAAGARSARPQTAAAAASTRGGPSPPRERSVIGTASARPASSPAARSAVGPTSQRVAASPLAPRSVTARANASPLAASTSRAASASRRPPLPGAANAAASSIGGGFGAASVLVRGAEDDDSARQQLPQPDPEAAARQQELQYIQDRMTVCGGLRADMPASAFDGAIKIAVHKTAIHSRRRRTSDGDEERRTPQQGPEGGGGADMNAFQLHACEAAADIELDQLPKDVGFIFPVLAAPSKSVNIRHASNVCVRVAFIPAPENPAQLRARMHTGGVSLVDIRSGSFAHFALPPPPAQDPHAVLVSSSSLLLHQTQQQMQPLQQPVAACLAMLERITATRCGRKVRNELAKMALSLQQRQEADYQRQLAQYRSDLAAYNAAVSGGGGAAMDSAAAVAGAAAAAGAAAPLTIAPKRLTAAALLLSGVSNTAPPPGALPPDAPEELDATASPRSDDGAADGGVQQHEQQEHTTQVGVSRKDASVAFLVQPEDAHEHPSRSLDDLGDSLAASGSHLFLGAAAAPAPPLAPVLPTPPPKPRLPIGWIVRNMSETQQRPYLPMPTAQMLPTLVDLVRQATFEKLPRKEYFLQQQQQQHQQRTGADGATLGEDETVEWMTEGHPQQQQQQHHASGMDPLLAPLEPGRRAAHALGYRWEAWFSAMQAVMQRHQKLSEVERWVESHTLQPQIREAAFKHQHPRLHSAGSRPTTADTAVTTPAGHRAGDSGWPTFASARSIDEFGHHPEQLAAAAAAAHPDDAGDEESDAKSQQQQQQPQAPESDAEWSSDEEAIADECFVTLVERAKAEEVLARCPSVDSEEELVFEQHHRHHHRRRQQQQQQQQQRQQHHHHRAGGDEDFERGSDSDGSGGEDGSGSSSSSLSTATTLSNRELNDVLQNAFVHGNDQRPLIVRNGRRSYSSGLPTAIPAGALRWGSVENPDVRKTLHLMHRVDDIERGISPHSLRHLRERRAETKRAKQQQQQQADTASSRSSSSATDSSVADDRHHRRRHLSIPGISHSTAVHTGFEPTLADALPNYDADRVTRYGAGCYNLGTKPEDVVGTYLAHRREYTTYARNAMLKVVGEQQQQQLEQLLFVGDRQQQQQQQVGAKSSKAARTVQRPQTAGETVLPRLRFTSMDANAGGAAQQQQQQDGRPRRSSSAAFDGMPFLRELAGEDSNDGQQQQQQAGCNAAAEASTALVVVDENDPMVRQARLLQQQQKEQQQQQQAKLRAAASSKRRTPAAAAQSRRGYSSSITGRAAAGTSSLTSNPALVALRSLGKPGSARSAVLLQSQRSRSGGGGDSPSRRSRRGTSVLPSSLVMAAQSIFADAPVDALRRRSNASGSNSPARRRSSPGAGAGASFISSSLFAASNVGGGGARYRSPSGRRGVAAARAVSSARAGSGIRAGSSTRGGGGSVRVAGKSRRADGDALNASASMSGGSKDVGLKLINYDVPDLAPAVKFEDAALNRLQDRARAADARGLDELRELIRSHDLGELMGHRTNDDSGVQRLRDVKKPRGDPKTIGLAKKLATRRRPAAEEVAEEERLRREAEEAEAARLGFDNGAAAAAAAAAAAMTGTSGPRSFRGGCFDSALIARERTDIEQLHGAKDGGVMACTVPGAFVSLLGKACAEVMHRTTRVIPGDNGATHQHVPRDETEEVPRPGVDVYGKVFFATRQALEQGFSPRPPDNPKPAASVRGGGAAGRSQRRSPSSSSSRRLGSASARRGSPLMAASSRSAYGASASTRPTSSGSAASSTRRTTQQGAAASASISLAAQRRQQHAQMSPEQRRQASANAMLARQEQRDLARDGAFASVQAVPPHVVLKM